MKCGCSHPEIFYYLYCIFWGNMQEEFESKKGDMKFRRRGYPEDCSIRIKGFKNFCCCRVAQSCWLFCDPMDYSPPGSSVHGISQARILEWVAISSSRVLSWPRDRTYISCAAGRLFTAVVISSVQFSSVTQSCPTLCDPMNHSTPGLPVHHHLPEFTQTHVLRVGDAIQLSHPLLSPLPPAPNPSQHQSLFQWVNSSHEAAKVLEFQL